MPIIFRKTAKGVSEIETRAHRLTPRMRSTLILVDGKRDAEDLRALVLQQADETLAALLQQEFIEAVGETLGDTLRGGPAAAGTAGAAGATGATGSATGADTDTPARPPINLDNVRRNLVRLLNEALGPEAESLAIRIERARSANDLRPLVAQAVGLVSSARGRAAGEAFAAKMPEL
ncbi:MAG: hypothetical protein LH480_01670 [Rubrivivax sp.]|nr:hypothetical protein [Rubrivivax sp.]